MDDMDVDMEETLDPWSLHEQLCLITVLHQINDDVKWEHVSSKLNESLNKDGSVGQEEDAQNGETRDEENVEQQLREEMRSKRPQDWFSAENCRRQYEALIKSFQSEEPSSCADGGDKRSVMDRLRSKLRDRRMSELRSELSKHQQQLEQAEQDVKTLEKDAKSISKEELDEIEARIEQEDLEQERQRLEQQKLYEEREKRVAEGKKQADIKESESNMEVDKEKVYESTTKDLSKKENTEDHKESEERVSESKDKPNSDLVQTEEKEVITGDKDGKVESEGSEVKEEKIVFDEKSSGERTKSENETITKDEIKAGTDTLATTSENVVTTSTQIDKESDKVIENNTGDEKNALSSTASSTEMKPNNEFISSDNLKPKTEEVSSKDESQATSVITEQVLDNRRRGIRKSSTSTTKDETLPENRRLSRVKTQLSEAVSPYSNTVVSRGRRGSGATPASSSRSTSPSGESEDGRGADTSESALTPRSRSSTRGRKRSESPAVTESVQSKKEDSRSIGKLLQSFLQHRHVKSLEENHETIKTSFEEVKSAVNDNQIGSELELCRSIIKALLKVVMSSDEEDANTTMQSVSLLRHLCKLHSALRSHLLLPLRAPSKARASRAHGCALRGSTLSSTQETRKGTKRGAEVDATTTPVTSKKRRK